MADLLTQSWIANQHGVPTAILRAGNVIGGGDFSENRLIPDLIRSIQSDSELFLRYPSAIRPWQSVLDCLDGYLAVLWDLLEKKNSDIWNVGPGKSSSLTVSQIADFALNTFSADVESKKRILNNENHLVEQKVLTLNTEKITEKLGWANKYSIEESLLTTMDWYKHYLRKQNLRLITSKQIEEYYAAKR
jgi:CDP-glucose 4,6-dehydratase